MGKENEEESTEPDSDTQDIKVSEENNEEQTPEEWEDEGDLDEETSTTASDSNSDCPTHTSTDTNTESETEESEENDDIKALQKPQVEPRKKRQDSWIIKGQTIQRIHRQARLRKFAPTEKNCPIPLKYIDITRRTETTLRDKSEACIYDCWYDSEEEKLSAPWIGRTIFNLIMIEPREGCTWVNGEEVQIMKTNRPGDIMKTEWTRLSKSRRNKEIERWKIEGPLQEKLRTKRNVRYIKPEAKQEWEEVMKKAREKYESQEENSPKMMISTDDEIKQKENLRFLREAYIQRRNNHTNHRNHLNVTRKGKGRSSRYENATDTENYGIKENPKQTLNEAVDCQR